MKMLQQLIENHWQQSAIYAFFAVVAYWVLQFAYDYYRGYSAFRGLKSLVIVGPLVNMPEMIYNFNRIYHFFLEKTREFSSKENPLATWTFKVPLNPRYFFVTDPKLVEFCLKTEFQSFEKGKNLARILHDLLGRGIFTSDGERWVMQRKATSQVFHVKNFREFFMEVFKEETDMLVHILDKCASEGTVVDLYELFNRLTLESFCRIGFGVELNLLKRVLDGDWSPVPFATAFDNAQMLAVTRIFNGFWPITEHLDGTRAKINGYSRIIDDFSEECIRQRRADPDSDQKYDLLSRFMRLKSEETGELFSDQELRDTVVNLIIAGRDTTAQALSWTFTELFQKPEIIKRMRQEIVREAPYLQQEGPASLDYDQVTNMQYCKAVFSEGLRLHPSVPKQGKMCTRDITLPDGSRLKKGDQVAFSAYVMGRLTTLWGENAEVFEPQRFIDENPSPFKFFAFNAGPRVCLGMQMAYLEAVTALASIVCRFDISRAVPAEDIEYAHGLTLILKKGLKVKVAKRV